MKYCMNCMAQYEDEYDICPHCGFSEGTLPSDSRCMEPGSILADRYIVGMPQSLDSWMVRYIGWDALTEKKVVINEFLPTRYAAREVGKTSLTVVRQEPFFRYLSVLLRRARQLAETRLPEAVCPVYESFEKNCTAYVITAFQEGQPLREFINERAPLNEPEAERLMLPVLYALDKLHDNGFIAGGFSPDNFVVADNGQFVMRDFIGNCFFHITDNPEDIERGQNDCYYPCERIEAKDSIRLAPENDIYSAAMIFYELLGVRLPDPYLRKQAYEQKHRDIFKRPSAVSLKLSKSKENALINASAPAVDIRTSDMDTFIKELTSDREVAVKSKEGKGFPLWAKIAIPAAAAVIIATAILVVPMFFAGSKKDLPLSDRTVVPGIINKTLEKAEEELQQAGLLLEVNSKTIDDSIDEGLVLTQSVEEGAMVGVNTSVGVSVSAHSDEFSMPNFLGMRLESCVKILGELGIDYTTSDEYSASVAEGCVVSQSVEPFTKVMSGSTLELTVSKGADPASADNPVLGGNDEGGSGSYYSDEPTSVSDYSGRSYEDAVEQAQQDQTPVEVVNRVYDDSLPDGTVIEQTPAEGEELEPGESVKVVVSAKSSSVILPDLTLMKKEVVEFILSYYGAVAEYNEEYSDSIAYGLVVSHDPPEDTEIKSGDTVIVTVSKGRQPAIMPDVVGIDSESAVEQLRKAGIAFDLAYDTDPNKPDKEILRQNVKAGDEVPEGIQAIITANAVSGVARVPDLTGLGKEDADKLAQDAELNMIVFVDRDHPFSEGKVYAQGPKPGSFLERGGDIVVFLTGKQEEPSGPPELSISTHSANINVGGEFVLEVDARNIQELSLVNYEIEDPEVIEVVHIDTKTMALTVRGKAAGTTTLTISCGNLRQACTVTVV